MTSLARKVGYRWGRAPTVVRAAIQATLATVFFACMTILIRHTTSELDPLQVVFFRNLLALMFMVPWLMRAGIGALKTDRFGMFGLRALIGLVGMSSGFSAIAYMPVTEATALSFTSPIFATIGAALVLGEVVRIRRWTAVVIGFLGAMIILRPGVEAIQIGAIFAMINAVAMATNKLVLKSLAGTERPEAIVTYMVLLLTPLSLIPALFVWTTPSWEMIGWMTALAGCGTAGHWLLTKAFAQADVTVILPFDFARLPFTALLAFLVIGEVPTIWTWIGGAVIFASTFYIARREAQLAKERRLAAAEAAD